MKQQKKLLRGYLWWCCILLLLYSSSSLLLRSSSVIIGGIISYIRGTISRIDERGVKSTLLEVTTEHRQLVNHVEQWLRTQDDDTMNHFIHFMDGKKKSVFVRRVEWVVDWVLGLYKVVGPIVILSLLSRWRRDEREEELEDVDDDDEREEQQKEQKERVDPCSPGYHGVDPVQEENDRNDRVYATKVEEISTSPTGVAMSCSSGMMVVTPTLGSEALQRHQSESSSPFDDDE